MKNIEELTFIFDALGEETRLKICVSLLEKDLNVSAISELLNMNQPHISHHLRILKDARIVKAKKVGKTIEYSLYDEHIKDILRIALAHEEC